MKYYINKKLMWIPVIIGTILFLTIIIQESASIIKPTQEASCPKDSWYECPNPLYDIDNCLAGKHIEYCQHTIPRGETININKHENELIPILNYGIWILIVKFLIINHLLYNRKYGFKELKAAIKKLTDKIEDPVNKK